MKQRVLVQRLPRQLTAFFLALVMLFGLLPVITPTAQAASWAQEYLDTLSDWNVMRGDIQGNLNPDRNITRAEFVALINRAYGYDNLNGNPFTDVPESEWYAEDIDIAYNVGYFQGTSETTAVPRGSLTREQAAVLLSRNLMLQPTVGETLGFSDSRTLSEWSRGLIGAAVNEGVVNGYSDGTFRPQNQITRGEVAAMLARALGNLVQEPGDYNLGSIYGNVTINSSGVNLRNTIIVGNLYLTGGIGLGDVLLENVTVRGQIIVSGAGESQSSQSSVNLRNVVADALIVDNISNQFVTVRAEGDTSITKTSVRTNSFVEDACPAGYGLHLIELDGEEGTRLQLAGNIKEVVNLTPGSALQMTQGTAQKITIDEHATGSTVSIDAGARIEELNLDVGTSVSGNGDIGTLNVAASGCVVTMLPDNITIRPGITATIGGTVMDSATAAESSAEPRLLAGYPMAKNTAPTSATLVFSTNKAGTVYWAITALADGSVGEDVLINPPSYAGTILKSGNVKADKSKTEYTANVTGLTKDGSYYITAVMVDARGNHSPLKVAAFSTPDDTVPAFTTGYPVMTKTTTKTSQVTVMTNKSCLLYYALLSKGSTAPTAQEMKAGAVTGNWGYGVVDVVRNVTQPINVNSITLTEQTDYDLYLWLTDYDGAKSSAVKKVTFKTPDETPPVVTDIMQTNAQASALEVTYALNEPGNLLWAIVAEGNDTFMSYDLDTLEAKVKVESGVGALRKGSSSAAKADTDIRLAISGLNTNTTHTTSYTLYYVAKDRAGNYGEEVQMLPVRTLDTTPPTVTQEFTKYNDDNVNEPLASTDIRLVFSESVRGTPKGDEVLMELYRDVKDATSEAERDAAREKLGEVLSSHIQLWRRPATGRPVQVEIGNKDNHSPDGNPNNDGSWVIDYRFATVTMEEGKMIVTFPTTNDTAKEPSALNLDSGATYYFRVESIYDTALTPNVMANTTLPDFRTLFAQVALSMGDTWTITGVEGVDKEPEKNPKNRIDIDFLAEPISVDRVDPGMKWDMLIWTDSTIEFALYSRDIGADGTAGAWTKVGEDTTISVAAQDGSVYASMHRVVMDDQTPDFGTLSKLGTKEYAIHINKLGDSDDFTAWNHTLNVRISIVAGTQYQLSSLATGSFLSDYEAALEGGVAAIGTPDPFNIRKPFTDSKAPIISAGYPIADVGDISTDIRVMMDRPGQVYYLVFPLSSLRNGSTLVDSNTTVLTEDVLKNISAYASSVRVADLQSKDIALSDMPLMFGDRRRPQDATENGKSLSLPTVNMVTGGRFTDDVIKGNTNNVAANTAALIHLDGLKPNTVYYVCMVTRATSAVYSENAIGFRFVTEEAIRPSIDLSATGDIVNVKVDRTTKLDYFLAQNNGEGAQFQDKFASHAIEEKWKFTDVKGGQYKDDIYTFTYSQNSGKISKMTVIDAMATPCYAGNVYKGSVFDIYATTQAKNDYASIIRSSSVTGNQIVMTGSGTYRHEDENTAKNQIKCTNMSMVVMYTFVSVGRGANGSGDAFRAYYPITLSDTTPPMVTSIDAGGYKFDPNGGLIKRGTVTLTFSESLYAIDEGSTTQNVYPVDNCPFGANHLKEKKSIAIGNLGGSSSSLKLLTTANNSDHLTPINTIRMSVTGLNYGEGIGTLSFRDTICDQSRNGLGRPPLTVTVKVVRTETGRDDDDKPVYAYALEATVNAPWDGTK